MTTGAGTTGPTLAGHRIVVVEDDYFLATDADRALRGAGADVAGPFASEEAAERGIDRTVTGAVIDVNLGKGPSFKLLHVLRDRGIPVVLVTGYDEATLPHEFAGMPYLQKPIVPLEMVSLLATTLGRTS